MRCTCILFVFIISFSFISKADNEIDPSSYYYSQLSDESKMIYDAMLLNAEHTKTGNYNITVKGFTSDQIKVFRNSGVDIVQSAVDAFDRDHPEIFWINISRLRFMTSIKGYIIISPSGDSYLINEYANENDPEAAINADISEIEENVHYLAETAAESEMDEEQKYRLIHDFLVENNDYNNDIENASGKAYKAVSAALGNIDNADSPVCEGYARAFKLYCDRLDLCCVIISGTVILNDEEINHMWNYVKCDERWYGTDVTWDDPVYTDGSAEDDHVSYEYFCLGYETFFDEHTEDRIFTSAVGYDFAFNYPLLYPYELGNNEQTFRIIISKYSSAVIECDVYNPDFVPAGTNVNITVTLNEDKKMIEGSLKVNGVALEGLNFTMPKKNAFITAAFINNVEIPDEEYVSKPDKKVENGDDQAKTDTKTQEPEKTEPAGTTPAPDKTGKDSRPSKDDKTTVKSTGAGDSTKKPSNTSTAKTSDNKKATAKPAGTKQTASPADTPKLPVIVQEEDFPEEDKEIHGIFAIKKADIVISNEMVYYKFPDSLKGKDIKIDISNSEMDTEGLTDIINKKYNIHEGSEIETLKVSLIDYSTGETVKGLDSNNKAVIYIPVDFSWLNADYATAFYQIKNGEAVRKLINVRESRGKYYLQLSMTEGIMVFAITRYKPDYGAVTIPERNVSYEVPGIDIKEETTNLMIYITIFFIMILIGVSTILLKKQYKLNKIEKRNQNNLLA